MTTKNDNVCHPLFIEADAHSSARFAWYDVLDIGLEGRGWSDVKAPFDRLPARADGMVPRKVWALSRHTAGLCVRFRADARVIRAKWKVRFLVSSCHMPDTAVRGLDLYSRAGEVWRWAGVGHPIGRGLEFDEIILENPLPGVQEYLLYLPLFSALRYLRLGFNEEARILHPEEYPLALASPYCFYGTSLTQGASVSRPGKAHTAAIGRLFGRPVINLGFSGHGKMDLEIAELMAELDCSVYFIDCVYNMSPELIRSQGLQFVTNLRAKKRDIPIVLISPPPHDNDWFLASERRAHEEKVQALHDVFLKLRDGGMNKLHLASIKDYSGDDYEASVGDHVSEIGHYRFVRALKASLIALGEEPKDQLYASTLY